MDKEKYITKKYFDKHTSKFATKKDLELMGSTFRKDLELMGGTFKKDMDFMVHDFKQYTTDLKTGFADSLMGIGEYVKSIDEKVDKLDVGLTSVREDITLIRNVLEEKASKKEVVDLRKRVVHLEIKTA